MAYLARFRNKPLSEMTELELDEYKNPMLIDAINLNVAKNRVKDYDDKYIVLSRYIKDAEREYVDAVRIDGVWQDGNGYGN